MARNLIGNGVWICLPPNPPLQTKLVKKEMLFQFVRNGKKISQKLFWEDEKIKVIPNEKTCQKICVKAWRKPNLFIRFKQSRSIKCSVKFISNLPKSKYKYYLSCIDFKCFTLTDGTTLGSY